MLIHEACLEHSRGEISVCQSSLVVIVGIVGCFIPDLFFLGIRQIILSMGINSVESWFLRAARGLSYPI